MLLIQGTTCLSMRKRISSNTSVIEVHQIIPCETGGQHIRENEGNFYIFRDSYK